MVDFAHVYVYLVSYLLTPQGPKLIFTKVVRAYHFLVHCRKMKIRFFLNKKKAYKIIVKILWECVDKLSIYFHSWIERY